MGRSLRLAGLAGAALLAVLGSPSASARPGAEAPRLTDPRPCPEASSFTCATLEVPLDRRGRLRERLRLRVAVRNGEGPLGTLLFLTGGPGQPGVPFAPVMDALFGSIFDGYRVVLLDQRGTGAGALRCPALQRQMGSTDLTVPTRTAVVACAKAIGPRRRFFSTADTVADLDALRTALGVEKLTIDAVSYGTFVAERYALAHPGRVARLVLDSVVPQAGAEALEVTNAHVAARVLRAVCRPGCVGDPAEDLAVVVRRRKDGPALLSALVTLSVIDPRFPGVAAALHEARQGKPGALERLLGRLRPAPGIPPEALSQGLHASTLCADTRMPWGGPAKPLAARAAATCRPSRCSSSPATATSRRRSSGPAARRRGRREAGSWSLRAPATRCRRVPRTPPHEERWRTSCTAGRRSPARRTRLASKRRARTP